MRRWFSTSQNYLVNFGTGVSCKCDVQVSTEKPSQALLWIDPDLLKFGGDTGQGDDLPKNLFV
jgi:hypothetical protein